MPRPRRRRPGPAGSPVSTRCPSGTPSRSAKATRPVSVARRRRPRGPGAALRRRSVRASRSGPSSTGSTTTAQPRAPVTRRTRVRERLQGVAERAAARDVLHQRGLLGEQQLGALAGGDVEQQSVLHGAVAGLVQHRDVVEHPDHAAVAGDQAVLRVGPAQLGSVRGLLGVEDPVPVVGVQQAGPEPGVVDELLRAVAEDRLDLRAGVEPGAVGAGARGVDRGRQLLGELRRDRRGARGLVGLGRRALLDRRRAARWRRSWRAPLPRATGVAWWRPRRVRPSPQASRGAARRSVVATRLGADPP